MQTSYRDLIDVSEEVLDYIFFIDEETWILNKEL